MFLVAMKKDLTLVQSGAKHVPNVPKENVPKENVPKETCNGNVVAGAESQAKDAGPGDNEGEKSEEKEGYVFEGTVVCSFLS